MKRLITLVAIAGIAMAGFAMAASPPPAGKGLIILVRHAERAQSASDDDPPLTAAGRARAERLATILVESGIEAVFITRFRRTQETAKPLADLLKLAPLEESDTVQLVAALRGRGNATVLVVGHSDTVPDVIKAFGGPTVSIADDEFDDVFVLVPTTGALTRFKY